MFAPCLYFQADLWKAGGFLFIFCCITQGLTLLFLESNICKNNQFLSKALYESKCEWDWGFKLNITSVVFWFLAGVLMIGVIPSPVRPERPPAETQTVTYSQGKQPDGTTVVAETNVVKGTYVPGTGIVEEQPSQV